VNVVVGKVKTLDRIENHMVALPEPEYSDPCLEDTCGGTACPECGICDCEFGDVCYCEGKE
jgi:hypothetical protein